MDNYQLERIVSKSGKETLKLNGYFLHSKYDPVKESVSFAEKHYKPNHVHIIFGYGAGYILKELKKIFDFDEQIICFEPIKEINFNDEYYDYLIQDLSEENLDKVLKLLITKDINVNFLCSPNYDKVFSEEYKVIIKALKKRIELNSIDENTLYRFSKDWLVNYYNNTVNIFYDEDVGVLQSNYQAPVVVASGGPSLTKQISLLKEYRNNFILIASGSTINTLTYYDIFPDYVVSIDGGINNYEHFRNKIIEKSILVYSLFNQFEIRNSFKNKCYYFLSQDLRGIEQHIKNIINIQPTTLLGGGSVATYALSFARHISTGPIAIIGQDLAYTDNKSHAEFNGNFKHIDEKNKKDKFLIEGYNGEKVLTDLAFFSMKETFEILIEYLNNNNEIFNCTEGGALIKGMRNLSFLNFINQYANDTAVKINNIKNIENLNDKKEILIDFLNKEEKQYGKLLKLIKDNLEQLRKVKKIGRFTSQINKKMDKNEKEIKKMCDKLPISIVMEDLSLKTLKYFNATKKSETIPNAFERVYLQNEYYFDSIKKNVEDSIDLLWEIRNKFE